MPSETRCVELDGWSVFWRVTVFSFLILEFVAWHRVGQFQFPWFRHRLIVFLLHPEFTRQSLKFAPILGGLVAILGVLVVRFVVRPALDRWLSPVTDLSVGAFHLGPGERIVASVSARRRRGRWWQPGSLVLTDLRLWFFPEAWSMEPWSVDRGEIRNVSTEAAGIAGWLPVWNWPENVVAETSAGHREFLAVSDPASVAAWFSAPKPAPFVPQYSLRSS